MKKVFLTAMIAAAFAFGMTACGGNATEETAGTTATECCEHVEGECCEHEGECCHAEGECCEHEGECCKGEGQCDHQCEHAEGECCQNAK